MPAIIDAESALAHNAPLLFPDLGTNIALQWDLDAVDEEFAGDLSSGDAAVAYVVHGEIDIPRVSTAPLEGHAIVVTPVGAGLHVHVSTQWPHGTRAMMARAFGLTLDDVRVQVPAVGGGFGGKTLGGIREHIATAAASRHLSRSVRWIEQRSDNLQSMQGRGVRLRYTADLNAAGRVLQLRVDDLCDAGAYPSTGSVEPGKSMLMSTGPYRIPKIVFQATSVVTNLPAPGAYRGPGRSEASMMLEHMMDNAARVTGLDRKSVV